MIYIGKLHILPEKEDTDTYVHIHVYVIFSACGYEPFL